ncbi:hypothetical protein BDV95DRAFT_477763, partial [Massariosphaeria phaeospora]
PIFNKPVCTERQYRISRILYLVFQVLLVILSTVVIGLKAMTVIFIEDNRDTGFEFETGDPEPTVLAALPRHLYTAPAKLALVAAAISMFVGIGHAVFVVLDWKHGKRTQAYHFRRNAMFLHFTNSILVLFSLVSISVTHRSSSHFRAGYVNFRADRPSADDGMRYNIGTFDLETWSCELKMADGARMVAEDYGRQCHLELAGRFVMIPFAVLGFALAGLGISQMIVGKRTPEGERLKTEDEGVEMGKFNA